MSHRHYRHLAFTLIELLVVVVIVALLAGLLMPVLSLLKAQAQSLRCLSSLRQLGIAASAYTDEHDGVLPDLRRMASNGTTQVIWFCDIAQYLGHATDGVDGTYTTTSGLRTAASVVWGCPPWNSHLWLKKWSGVQMDKPGYGMNVWPIEWPSSSDWVKAATGSGFGLRFEHYTWNRISLPSQRILLGDSIDWHLSANGTTKTFDPNSGDPTRHRGRANYAFFDGHATSLPATSAPWGIVDPASTP